MKSYLRGTTVRIKATIRDIDDTLTDPITTTITITDPDGTVRVSAVAMTNTGGSTGLYHYDWQTVTTEVRGVPMIKVTATTLVSGTTYTVIREEELFEIV